MMTSEMILKIFLLLAALFAGSFLYSEDFIIANQDKLTELARRLEDHGVSQEWFWEQIERDNFRFHEKIEDYFINMTEHRYSRGEIDIDDYKSHFNVRRKVELGRKFIAEHKGLLVTIQERNGIDFELIVAILGMETNYAQQRHRGNFYVFDALVSQYLLVPRRENFAVNQLVGLHIFMEKTGHETDYFIGSFAGASGWAQFIPTSLNSFFVSADDIDENIDIFSIADTLASIENYLFNHGLREETMSSDQQIWNAVFAYNRSSAYVKSVLFIYRELQDAS